MQKKKKKKKKRTMWQRTGHLHIYPYVCQTENIIQRSIANAYFHMSPQCSVSTVIRLPHQSQLKNRLSLLGIYISSNTSDHILHLYRQCHRTPFRKHVFNHIVESVTDFDQCLDSLLVQFFVENGSLDDAYDLICCLNDVSILVWNCLISAYAEKGRPDEALHVFQKMQERGICPDKITFLNAMSSCNSPLHLLEGKVLHDSIIFSGCETDVMVGTTLVTMYSRCGSLHDASKVFDNIRNSNVVSWTAMIAAYARYGQDTEAFQYFDRMKQEAVIPNRVTFLCFLESCFRERSLEKGKQLHSSSIAMKLDSDVNLLTAFLNMYDRCGSLEHVKHIFVTSPNPDVVLWNATMAAFIHHKEIDKALHMFDAMQQEGVIPNVITYATSISACVVDSSLRNSKRMHVRIVCGGLEDDIIVATSLINMYGKNGNLKIASQLFDHLSDRNVVSWNTIILAYAQQKRDEDVMQLVETMHQEGICANEATYLSAIEAYTTSKALLSAKRMHCRISKSRLETNTVVATAIATMYSRCGSFKDAQSVFNEISHKNIISWNMMVSVCGQHGWLMQAFKIYEQMQDEGIDPDQATYTSILSVCTNQIPLLTLGAHIHSCIILNGFEPDIVVGTSLLNMYGKCGSLEDACKIFDRMNQRNVVSWNVMISIYSQHGHAKEAIRAVHKMQEEQFIPNKITFIAVISACSHGGMLVEGCTNLCPSRLSLELYHCMFDLLGRAGLIDDTEDLINIMPLQPSPISWVTLLGACRKQDDVVHGTCAAKHVFELDPYNTASTLMLEKMYANDVNRS